MQRYNGQLINQFPNTINGNAAAGAQVTIRVKSSGALATLYATNSLSGGTLPNPLITDAKGYYGFYAADGVYTLDVNISGTPQLEIQLQDVADLQAQFNDAVSNAGYIPVGTFAAGCTVSQANGVVSDGSSYWRWDGALPKTVTAGSEPLPVGVGGWFLVGGNYVETDALAAVDSTVLVGGVEAGDIAKSSIYVANKTNSVAILDQFVRFLGGRGMLATETPSIATERFITSNAAAGSTSIAVSTSSNIEIGSRVMVFHSAQGLYESYFVNSKSATTIGLSTGLKYPVTANQCKLERLWYNQPHPGKFYMRMLAQKIARMPSVDLAAPSAGRLYFSQLDSNPTDANDLAVAIGGASVSYVNELNISQGDVAKPLESMIGRALFISGSANGFGAKLPLFKTYGAKDAVLSAVIMCRDSAVNIEVQIVDTDGFVQTVLPITGGQTRNAGLYNFRFKLTGRTDEVFAQVVAVSGVTGATSVIVDQLEIMCNDEVGPLPVIDKTKPCTIVGLGDSWIAGDTITTPERESILTQLAIELPKATIINSGIGGQKVWQMYERFETDVAAYNPDYVIVNTGTNDCYSPISGVFFPNSVDQFERYYNLLISKILAIGAKPIVIGVPALAEADGSFSGWALNDRAKTYHRYFYKRLSRVADYSEAAPVEPVITSFTPTLKIGGSETGITYSSRVGSYTQSGRIVSFTMQVTLTSKGSNTGSITLNMPPVTNSGGATPFATTLFNVNSASAGQFVGSIGVGGEMRLQIPSASGAAAATEANINNNTTFYVAGSYLTVA